MARTRLAVALLLSIAGGALALILLSKHYGVPLLGEAVMAACGADGGCDIVSQSRYAVFLSLPLAAWGLIFYGSLAGLLVPALFARREEPDPSVSLAFLLSVTAIAIDVVLFGLQVFAIKAFCKFCIATYFVNLMTAATLWPHRQFERGLAFLTSPESRRALSAWVFATLWVAAAAVAGNSALEGRKAEAASSILGVPTMLQKPAPTNESGSAEERVAEARAEAKKWKDILDDDRKLQIYLNQKARDDFNRSDVISLELNRSPSQGAPNAPITVVSFSDFMCPFCRDLAAGLHGFLPSTGNQVKSQYKHYPLDNTCNTYIGQSLHPGSCELSLGGICAQEKGRFWEYHDKVFGQRWERATREDALRIGVSVGLERASLSACMEAAATKGLLAKDIDEGARAGVGSTPTVFVNGRKLQSTGVFLLAIEEERKRLKLPVVTGAPAQEK